MYNHEEYILKHIGSNYYTFYHEDKRPLSLSITEVCEAIRESKLDVAPVYKQPTLSSVHTLSDRDKAICTMKLAQAFRTEKNITTKAIKEVADKIGVPALGKSRLYEHLSNARKYGWYLEVFLPKHKQKGFRGSRYPVFLEHKAEQYIYKHYLKGGKVTQRSLYDSFKGYCLTDLNLCDVDVPCIEWFRQQLKKVPQFEKIQKRKGSVALKQTMRDYFQRFHVENILDRVEFDFYSPKTLLITETDGKEEISSRVFFCVAIDTYSRMPLAIVTLSERGESANCFRLCVKQAMQNPILSTITGDAIYCCGLIKQIVVDAGSGFSQESFINNLVGDFGILYQTTEVQAPYRKPYVENFIYQIKNQFEVTLPCSYEDIRDEGKKDKINKRKAITVDKYLEYLNSWIVDSYAITKQTGDTKTPLERWQSSFERTKPFLPDDFDIRFSRSGTLETGKANYRSGINKYYTFYNSPELQKLLDIERSIDLQFYVEPLDMSSIFVINPGTSELLRVPSIKPVIQPGTTLEDHLAQMKTLRRHKPAEACIAEYKIREEAHKTAKRVKAEPAVNTAGNKPKSNAKDARTGYEACELTEELLNETVHLNQSGKVTKQRTTTRQHQDDDFGMTTFSKK
ncbi:DDE-type integrase/transposase/recombinase [Photobacterium sp. BZF1]|uniref:DDE-type integrase/transposase/recombinase n=1 Tax=Photobacterium sp. BZF1 TaxID=1904457 RepID=UPI001653B2F1|nr:DDE-type integrase/transposase/recombinase [Photobacterium sp. BZF1]MBC7006618.1 DDE-type integrase/transposase/recombinase [Photobacterium sp. BZF1]